MGSYYTNVYGKGSRFLENASLFMEWKVTFNNTSTSMWSSGILKVNEKSFRLRMGTHRDGVKGKETRLGWD